MTLAITFKDDSFIVCENVLEILNVPDTMNLVIKCGFPHWESKALIRNDVKKMEVLV